ncbi:integrase/recombinase XerC [Alkalibacillus flavidus]|uniref:Tyrosine recombinase XerC n=1 Tax=Alkalibacillus flavidus TaxID=546021 RepID=A0ABV2KTW4_9BACI
MTNQQLMHDFNQFLNVERNASSYTIDQYQADLQQFHMFLEHEQIEDFTHVKHSDVRLYLTQLYDQGLSRVSASRKLSSLRTFYTFLEKEGLVGVNPIEYVSTPKKDRKIPQFFYEEELEKLFETEDLSMPLGQRNQAIIELMYATGVRVSELVQITIGDIDFSLNTVLVHGKGMKQRYIPFGAYAENALRQYLRDGRLQLQAKSDHECDDVFLNHRGAPLTDEGVRYILNDVMKRAALTSSIHPHKLRHTFATHLLNQGADMRSVQELLGHESLSSTQIYTHVTKDYLQNIYNNAHPRA